MQMLIVGLDGGDERIIRELRLPFLMSLLDSSIGFRVEEDLWSRGWVEILSGEHGRVSGGFYSRPKLDGSHLFESSFTGRDYNQPGLSPLWKLLNSRGHRVGFLGFNTTFPPPPVDGFFVAGPGGGSPAALEVPKAACSPSEIFDQLSSSDYIWEVRYRTSGIRDVGAFFDLLAEEAMNRIDPFIELCRSRNVEAGFIHHKIPIVMQNLAMVEVEALLSNGGVPENSVQRGLVQVYRALDESTRRLFEVVNPSRYMLVSDHGAAPYLTTINVNAFLEGAGYRRRSSALVQTARSAGIKAMKALIPRGRQKAVKGSLPKSVADSGIQWRRTRAFGARYINGIYLNDEERFGGPVRQAQAGELVRELIDAFNATAEARQHGLSARPYREEYRDAPYQRSLPDIWIDKPDTAFFELTGGFAGPNPNYRRFDSFAGIEQDLYSGIKSRYPLLYVDSETAALGEAGDPGNLTLAHKLIDRSFR